MIYIFGELSKKYKLKCSKTIKLFAFQKTTNTNAFLLGQHGTRELLAIGLIRATNEINDF